VLVALHVICAVVGFGSVAITGMYGAGARHPERFEDEEETARYFRSRGWPELLILAVPVFGAGALAQKWGDHAFTRVWVVAGILIWAAASGLLLGVVRPCERRIRAGTQPAASRAGSQLMWAAVGCDVLFVAALVFMVAQPP
jgi:undecaprenyl pyrophosphate phosphatase UppP